MLTGLRSPGEAAEPANQRINSLFGYANAIGTRPDYIYDHVPVHDRSGSFIKHLQQSKLS